MTTSILLHIHLRCIRQLIYTTTEYRICQERFSLFSRFFEKTFGQSLPCPKGPQNQFASMDSMHAESTSLMMGTHTELPLPASSTITIKASG